MPLVQFECAIHLWCSEVVTISLGMPCMILYTVRGATFSYFAIQILYVTGYRATLRAFAPGRHEHQWNSPFLGPRMCSSISRMQQHILGHLSGTISMYRKFICGATPKIEKTS